MKFSQLGWKSLLTKSLRSLASEECFSFEKKTLIPEEHSQFLKFLFRQIKISFPMQAMKKFSYLACKREYECPIFLPLFLTQREM